jgi:hypothetical protein
MTIITNGHSPASIHQQLRDLNTEYRETQTALNQAQASLNRGMKLMEENYQRKRRDIMNGATEERHIRGNGHYGEDPL